MVKVKTVCRPEELYTRETTDDIYQHYKNPDSTLHPLQQAREYMRALNSAKLEKVFAKPFLASMDEHTDSVYVLGRSDVDVSMCVSGSCNGEIKVWDLSCFKSKMTIPVAHNGFVTGLVTRGDELLSVGRDALVKLWRLDSPDPVRTYNSSMTLTGVDKQWEDAGIFATCGSEGVYVWDKHRSSPLSKYHWSSDSQLTLKFNPSETSVLASTGADCSITLYDIRGNTPLRKTVLKNKSNALAWNPREPMFFTVANEDSNLYTFDLRKLTEAFRVHKDHLNAVLSVAFSPTGREFVSGSYDRTLRIFPSREGHSREVYHTRRMQWVYAVEFSGDGKFVLSGSDDTNVRVWKARSHMPLKTLMPREQEAIQYREKLKSQYRHVDEIRRILRHRHLPRLMFRQRQQKQEHLQSQWRKQQHIKAHLKPGAYQPIREKQKPIVTEQE